jgi:MFS family permease|tara:strand:- start:1454 stop:2731 length:1278 start_codon:yes stop_codon:yes gene_type:complete
LQDSNRANGSQSTTGAKYFYGWRMVLVAFCVDFVAVGFFFYSYGVFFKAIAEDFGGSRLGIAFGLTVTNIVGAIAAPYVGRALDKYPLKHVMGVGATFMAVGFLGLSFVRNPIEFYLVLGIFVGFGASSMGSLATSKLVANWFDRRRGTALGIAAAGVSLSGVIMPYISAELINNYGWREGFLVYGLFTLLVVLPMVLRFVVTRPEDIGMRPDGAMPIVVRPGVELQLPKPRLAMRDVFREHNFWVIVLTFSLIFCCMGATLTHMIPRLTDNGYTLVQASLVMSLCAGFGVTGKLSFGWLGDRLSLRKVMSIVIVMQFTGQLLMYLSVDLVVFAVGASLFGYGVGGVVPMHGATVGKTFGRDRFGAILGLMRPAMLPIQILGVPFAGWIYDVTGSYAIAFEVFLGIYFLAAVALSFYRQPPANVQ